MVREKQIFYRDLLVPPKKILYSPSRKIPALSKPSENPMENLVHIIASLSCLNVALPDATTVKSASYCISFTEMVSPAPEALMANK